MKRIAPALLPALLLTSLPAPALAQGAGQGAAAVGEPEPQSLATELATLNATLERIADLLAAQVDQDGLSLLMKRSELASAFLRQSEDQLRSARGRRESLEDERLQIEARLSALATDIESGAVDVEEEAPHLSMLTEQAATALESINRRLKGLDAEIAELENRVTSQESELRHWQDVIDRRLGGL